MADLDQGGVFRETSRVYLGPSLGWSQQVSAPPVSAITVTTPGTTIVQQGVSTVHVNVNGSVTIQLYAARGNVAGAGQVPGSWVQTTLTVNDTGGHAQAFPITILPAPGETIGGAAFVTIGANFGLFVMLSDVQNGGWTVASGTSGTALTDAPSDGSTYGRLNAAWSKVLPLAGGTLTGALTIPSGSVSGVLTVPTPAVDTSTTQVANTAFVLAQASAPGDGTPAPLGVAARGVSTHYARADHVHPTQTFVLRSYLAGLTITPGGGTLFTVNAGVAADSGNVDMMTLVGTIVKSSAAWVVGNNNGGLDTGAIAANTWYHVYLIKRTDTQVVDVLFSLSVSSPTMPTSYTENRRIGSMLTDGSSHFIAYTQLGDEFIWFSTVGDVSVVNLGTTSTLFPLTVPTGVQVNALGRATIASGTAGTSVLIQPPDQTTEATLSVPGNTSITAVNTTTSNRAPMNIRTNTSAQIRAVASAASTTFQWATYGWTDRRGRDA